MGDLSAPGYQTSGHLTFACFPCAYSWKWAVVGWKESYTYTDVHSTWTSFPKPASYFSLNVTSTFVAKALLNCNLFYNVKYMFRKNVNRVFRKALWTEGFVCQTAMQKGSLCICMRRQRVCKIWQYLTSRDKDVLIHHIVVRTFQ